MRRWMIALVAGILFLLYPSIVNAEGEEDAEAVETSSDDHSFIDRQIERLQLDEIQSYWEEVSTEYGGFLPESQKGSFKDFITGEKKFQIKDWGLGLIKFLLHELIVNSKLLGMLILLTLFSQILQTIQSAFESQNVSKAAYSVTYLVLMILAMNSFYVAITYASEAINSMIHFMIALLPLLLALMASIGSLASSALFHPLIIFLVNTSGILVNQLVLPLLFFSAVLGIVSTLSDHYKVSKLADFLRNISVGLLGIFMTVFLGVISVQGASTAATDGLTVRTAKFIAGNFIPVVGKMFTDATDTVMSASVLLKNTVGMTGLGILFMICVFPLLKVLSLGIIFNLSAAVLQPLGGGPIIECLSIIGKSVMYVFAALALVSLMFFLAITLMVAASNLSFMMR
ncbi:stage III sporulation protein AE [Alkalicoccobacillus murimartini]|uniref:Stage III sporulation protein AE n=1 Tax=Alkalicoccobacillus murimartini TaxID=171685 RepID=A0ABT9YM61_9BACI|nr:stage III sporulation protein AE [Alkalicoccobacillus murimartini]MDQ0208969.1 stage III sporulation protein AE [Alkalicoccobacillus murimartini]